jgi:hypothetical protein
MSEQNSRPDAPHDVERDARNRPHPEAPRKEHGDALREGTGTRHGVTERTERPETRPQEGPDGS